MKVKYLVFEIGSTTTLASAFDYKEGILKLISQGRAYTTVLEGDVTLGLKNAIKNMEEKLKEKVEGEKIFATSSAAGGLKISVHGLMYDMTVKAGREAALGAGGIIKFITSGKLRKSDIKKIKEKDINLILISGGVDYGERDTTIYNSELIAREIKDIPILYCGNIENHEDVKEIFKNNILYISENVYPTIDELNVESARSVIQKAFEENITKAKGMEKIKQVVQNIMTTPGAIMESAKILYKEIGDLVIFDVGGATTDIHSITEGSKEILDILISPEPIAKRTVEGDLGVFINRENLIGLLEEHEILDFDSEDFINEVKAIPITEKEKKLSRILTKKAVKIAIKRHVGKVKRVFGENRYSASGKDLSLVKYIIGTGGALTHLGKGEEILEKIKYKGKDLSMMPSIDSKVLIDKDYILAAAGIISKVSLEDAMALIKESLGI